MSHVTQEYLHETFDFKDGHFIYKEDGKYGKKKGAIAGFPHNKGYWAINIKGKLNLAHRLSWLYHHGYMPTLLDHIDGNRLNNNIDNLRIASYSQNQFNRKVNKNSSTGIKGLQIQHMKGKNKTYTYFRAEICHQYRKIVKLFNTKSEAVKFLKEIRADLHGPYARNS